MFIYLITNVINGKRYVGKAKDLKYRWLKHRTSKSCPALRNAIDKYGMENFNLETIGEVPDSFADEFEIDYIDRYNTKAPNGYNLTDGGEGPSGYRHSEETRKLLSEKLKGNKCAVGSIRSPEYKASASERSLNMSEEQKELLRQARLRQQDPRIGKTHSEESKKKMSLAHMNISDDTRQKQSAASKRRWEELKADPKKYAMWLEKNIAIKTGTKRSEETKARMKAAWVLRRLKESNV